MAKPIWPKASSARVDRSLSAHSIVGLAISVVLYVICLSGVVAVFEDELEWWEQPATHAVETVSPQGAQAAAQAVSDLEETRSTHLYLYLPREDWPRFVAATDNHNQLADGEGRLVGALSAPWNTFLIDLHYYLHMPASFGMILVAIFGVMLLAMSVSGLLAHPRIFRDAFRLRRSGQSRLVQIDLHNRLSVWTAPFHIAIALTGAMIGLLSVFAFVFAQTSHDGDVSILVEAIYGAEAEPDETPAPLPRIDQALLEMSDRFPQVEPFLVVVHEPGTVSQELEIYGDQADRLIYGEIYKFSSSGEFLSTAGISDGSMGTQVAWSVYRLHFGDFAGLWMKVIYFGLGVALCVIIASGLNIYFIKRAERASPLPQFAAAWSACVWGAPALLAGTLLASQFGVQGGWLTGMFWIGLAALGLVGFFNKDAVSVGKVLRIATGVILLASVGVQSVRTDIAEFHGMTLGVTVALTLCALALFGREALQIRIFSGKRSADKSEELAG